MNPAAAAALVAPGATAGPARPLDLPDATPAGRPATPPPGDGATRPEQPAAQRPTAARPPSVSIQRRPPTRRLEPGDLICPDCGEGNPDTRKFCSRCGASLVAAQVVKAKWWQKLLPRRGPKKRKAGDRPSARKTRKSFPSKVLAVLFGGVSRVVGVILLIGGLVYGIVPGIRNQVNEEIGSVKGWVNGIIHPTRTEVIPTGVQATSQLPGHAAQLLIDRATNTYWLARVPKRTDRRISIDFIFQNPFDLKNIAVWNGVGSSKDPDYGATRRAGKLFLEFPDTNISGCTVPLNDRAGEADKQNVSGCNADKVDRVRISILEYDGDPKIADVAISKIQFYKKG